MNGTDHPDADILIVTALPLEREAVRQHLQDVSLAGPGNTTADIGTFDAEGTKLTVAVIETGSGNVDASVITSSALRDLHPDVVVIVGVAGGLKDVEIGDVVVSRKLYWLEPGKQTTGTAQNGTQLHITKVRPDFGPVSHRLLQRARAVVANKVWRARAAEPGGGKRLTGEPAEAVVAPLAIVEKVVADSQAALAVEIRTSFSDTVAVAMEDIGVARAVAAEERAALIAVRGVSDMLKDKAATDVRGAQPLAAANAAAFAFELIAVYCKLSSRQPPHTEPVTALADLAATLYPEGPTDNAVWRRAGGDTSKISLQGPGHTRWWNALHQLELGGGGSDISRSSLLATMMSDYPSHPQLAQLVYDEGNAL